ncbi:glycosyltransferase [Cupriavidus necator]|uniref:Glycosyltransferase n=1 Tax=Cupriavidus necator TaxID=106590 RepID=A0A367PFX3_CUPNE|nr:glycosyltransferase [Cupriavidus necator]QQX83630.1 glycosyltransferase [Cupriavidus necator]RCJ06759.1 glycosyltransferase [Cupriavidus necator]
MTGSSLPAFSIVINTLNRANSLAQTLESLCWLKYRGQFEVIVVNGPSTDHSQEIVESWGDRIRWARCPVANLSVSRNIGIAMAAGDIVAFIDDDGIPEPEWLEQIAAAYDDPNVGAVGGLVFDHTGYEFQYKYCVVDRYGEADLDVTGPTPHLCFPKSFHFPHLLGTNCTFRRQALLEIQGFDEEFEYYLDETDVCARLIDLGYFVRQLPNAYVHHKFAPSNLRGTNRVAKYRYPIIKNRIYFSLKHAREYEPLDRILENQTRFVTKHRDEVRWCVGEGLLKEADVEQFELDAERAIETGLRRGFEGPRDVLTEDKLSRFEGAFKPFDPIVIADPKTIVLVSRDYPPGHGGGIATFTRDLASALGKLGHIVHVITQSPDINRVDFEAGVWVHRIVPTTRQLSGAVRTQGMPEHIWNWSASALAEARRIAGHRRIDAVEAPIWDCEGIAFLLDGEFPLVTSLHTTLGFWLQSHPEKTADAQWMQDFGTPMLKLEARLLLEADAIRANSQAIVLDIERQYEIRLPEDRLQVIPHGLGPSQAGQETASARVNGHSHGKTVLFVGRLEHRKGIDVLLEAIPTVLDTFPGTRFRIIGDNTQIAGDGKTYQEQFAASRAAALHVGAVSFEGRLDDHAVHQAYAECDLFVAPSRYESFGLIFLEAMREGKAVIGCAAGGMPEVIEDKVTGLLVRPGDVRALTEALLAMLGSDEMRSAMGKAARERFATRFTAARMGNESQRLYALAASRHKAGRA